jgi:sirohydrochlorin cobaltochelatase
MVDTKLEQPTASVPGLVLLAHGSRDALWRQPIEAVQAAVQAAQPALACSCAYLDACAPDLPAAVADLLRRGSNHITVLPLFLGTGKHAREDIPRLVEQLRQQHPACRFELQAAVGEHPSVTTLLAQLAIEQALAGSA